MYKYNNHVKRDKERRKLQSVLANPMVYLQQGNQVHKGHICCLGNKKKRCPDIRKYAVVSIPQKYLYTVPTLWCEAQHHKPQRLC